MDEFDIRDIDREALFDCLAVAEGKEYEELSWYRDLLYLLDEGFIDIDVNGRAYVLEEIPSCPE